MGFRNNHVRRLAPTLAPPVMMDFGSVTIVCVPDDDAAALAQGYTREFLEALTPDGALYTLSGDRAFIRESFWNALRDSIPERKQ
jgi:hypothetical protein